jgi:hypothetical protein
MSKNVAEINCERITEADLAVGLPVWREESDWGEILHRCAWGLKQYFKSYKPVIIIGDSRGLSGQGDDLLKVDSQGIPRIHLTLETGSRGLNSVCLVQKALALRVRALALLGPEAAAVKPVWIKNLFNPVLQGYDMVTPLYMNSKYDNPLTNLLVYPLLRCAWGRRVRQPLGEERAFSFPFMSLLAQEYGNFQNPRILEENLDIWSTMLALSRNMKLCQTYLAEPRPNRCSCHLPGRFKQVGEMLFQALNSDSSWINIKWSRPTAFYGLELRGSEPLYTAFMNKEEIVQKLRSGWQASRQFLSASSETKALVEDLAMDLPAEMNHVRWARLILESFRLYQRQPEMLSRILDALLPVFWARMLYFINETEKMDLRQVENFFETQCLIFEQNKEVFLTPRQ